jgi:type I restriction enzyme R subunit
VLLQDRLKLGKERLDSALEALALLCEPVQPPKGELQYIHYFCGNTEIASDLAGTRTAAGDVLPADGCPDSSLREYRR